MPDVQKSKETVKFTSFQWPFGHFENEELQQKW